MICGLCDGFLPWQLKKITPSAISICSSTAAADCALVARFDDEANYAAGILDQAAVAASRLPGRLSAFPLQYLACFQILLGSS